MARATGGSVSNHPVPYSTAYRSAFTQEQRQVKTNLSKVVLGRVRVCSVGYEFLTEVSGIDMKVAEEPLSSTAYLYKGIPVSLEKGEHFAQTLH